MFKSSGTKKKHQRSYTYLNTNAHSDKYSLTQNQSKSAATTLALEYRLKTNNLKIRYMIKEK